jgi:ABC-type Fe3+-hydroxamate transport system substrate-binding protein
VRRGHWTPQLIELAGGRHPLNPTQAALGGAAPPSRAIGHEALVASDPDIVILAPCGFDLALTLREARGLWAHAWWRGLRAVRERRVMMVDGNQMFNRWVVVVWPI